MGVENRVNISSLAKGLQKEGVTTQSTLLSGYRTLKPEISALTSIFVNGVTTRSLSQRENRPPFGFVSIVYDSLDAKDYQTETVPFLDDEDPFLSWGRSMRNTLTFDMMEEVKALEEGNMPDNLQSVYSRLSKLLAARHETIPDFVTPGINTAVAVMFGVLEVIPRVCDGDFDPQQLTQIATNSYPLIVKLASLHIDVFADLSAAIMDPFHPGLDELFVPFDPRFFRIGGTDRKIRLEASADLLTLMKQLTDALNSSKDQHPSPAVGCPAIVNLSGGSPMKRVWDWGVQTAQPIYNSL